MGKTRDKTTITTFCRAKEAKRLCATPNNYFQPNPILRTIELSGFVLTHFKATCGPKMAHFERSFALERGQDGSHWARDRVVSLICANQTNVAVVLMLHPTHLGTLKPRNFTYNIFKITCKNCVSFSPESALRRCLLPVQENVPIAYTNWR